MISADVALALLINRTTQAYQTNPPAYIAYRERTHISVPSMGRSQDIDRFVVVRNADDFAVMQDLPQGARRTGQAFPIIPYFDPISTFSFAYFANPKKVDISITRGDPVTLPIPSTDPSVSVVVPYNSYWAAQYAPDSTPDALHVTIDPTTRVQNSFYPAEVVEDPQTHLPSRIVMKTTGADQEIALDYHVVDGHWVVTHGVFSATEHVALLTFNVIADVTYDQFTFPSAPPDPLLAGSPSPRPTP